LRPERVQRHGSQIWQAFRRQFAGHSWRASDKVFFPLMETIMAIPKELLAILVCPVCKKPVQLLVDHSGLKCEACKRVYPVRDDIPVMLPEEARVVEE
jgi:uncharacterized protein